MGNKPTRVEFINRKAISVAAAAAGVMSGHIRKVLNLQNALKGGDSIVELWHEDFQVVSAGKKVKEIVRPITANAANANVGDVKLIPEGTELPRVKFGGVEHQGPRMALYTLFFNPEITVDSSPVKFALHWVLHKTTCMEKDLYQEYYPGNDSFVEDTSVDFLFPVRSFEMTVQFPFGYIVEPKLTIAEHGSVLKETTLEFDRTRHEVSFSGANFGLGMKCKISWSLP
jgi:hypothetical protein